MSGFLYFVSDDDRPPTPDKLRRWGLGYAFPAGCEHRPINNNSPNGRPGGVIVDPKRHDRAAGYHKDQQTWRKMPTVEGRPELWVGYWNEAKPGAEDLVRPNMLPGEVAMTLGDGNRWVIPTLAEFDSEKRDGDCTLPAPLDFDDEGNLFTTSPVGEYGELWEVVHPVAVGVCFGGTEPDAEIREPLEKDIRAAAFRLLRTNYVVDMPELVMLGCLRNDATFRTIVIASCRGQWLMDAINLLSKKNDSPTPENGSDTSDGKAA